jgi:putative ABC transport system substrate-binding protein
MRRRQFIAGLAGAAAWPVVARAQQPNRMRRVAVLMALGENEAASKAFLSALTQGLSELGWSDGHNLRMDVRWAASNVDRMRILAKEVVDLQPDVILTDATPVTAAVQRETRTISIVFVFVSDPIGFRCQPAAPGRQYHWV